jgi:2-succinyl-6-hydroxy-2,4-cyclohexadiene-1-carboxylate synthase
MEKRLKSFDGTTIYYDYVPGRTPFCLVFLHGVGANWTVWKKEMRFFQKKGFTTLALDLRGHGCSDAPEEFSKYKMENFSRDLHAVLKKEKVISFALVGHSLGGGVAINYCMKYPKESPSSLILVETACLYPFDRSRLLNLGPHLNHLLRFISTHKLTRDRHFFHFKEVDLSDLRAKIDLKIISHLMHLTPLRTLVKTLDNVESYIFKNKSNVYNYLQKLKIPVLVIAGDQDPIVPAKFSLIIKKLLRSAELRVVKDNHHLVITENPEKVSEIMQNFLLKNFSKFFCI